MKSSVRILLSILLVGIGIFYGDGVFAKTVDISIKEVELIEQSDNVLVEGDPTSNGLNINSDITFYEENDFVKYKITLQNNDNEDYEIKEISNSNENEYIKYDYSFEDKQIQAKKMA